MCSVLEMILRSTLDNFICKVPSCTKHGSNNIYLLQMSRVQNGYSERVKDLAARSLSSHC